MIISNKKKIKRMVSREDLSFNETKIHTYCLMTNHIHLLLETLDYKIGKIMQKIAGDYARTYNRWI